MKEHPVIFNGDMVRAIFAGRKTQTRRVIKPQPDELRYFGMVDNRQFARFWTPGEYTHTSTITDVRCPYGVPGDHLWVRETWCDLRPHQNRYAYKASDTGLITKWKPSIHMPRWASRITLEVTNVHVERVQDISENDAHAEGVTHAVHGGYVAREGFQNLWDSINAKRGYGWDFNPWVWVVEFRHIDGR